MAHSSRFAVMMFWRTSGRYGRATIRVTTVVGSIPKVMSPHTAPWRPFEVRYLTGMIVVNTSKSE